MFGFACVAFCTYTSQTFATTSPNSRDIAFKTIETSDCTAPTFLAESQIGASPGALGKYYWTVAMSTAARFTRAAGTSRCLCEALVSNRDQTEHTPNIDGIASNR